MKKKVIILLACIILLLIVILFVKAMRLHPVIIRYEYEHGKKEIVRCEKIESLRDKIALMWFVNTCRKDDVELAVLGEVRIQYNDDITIDIDLYEHNYCFINYKDGSYKCCYMPKSIYNLTKMVSK